MACNMYITTSDFRERNATVARKWAELTEDERKGWAAKAEAVCSSSMQVHVHVHMYTWSVCTRVTYVLSIYYAL